VRLLNAGGLEVFKNDLNEAARCVVFRLLLGELWVVGVD
jgi:hypothetical protein